MHLSQALEASTAVNSTTAGVQSEWEWNFYAKFCHLIYHEAYKGLQVILSAALR